MESIDDVLATGRRGLRTRPGTFLLGPTGARLWADYLEPRPGFVGAIDLVHKLNIPMLFTVTGVELPAPWEADWRPSHLSVRASSASGVEFTEDKFVTWSDCAVSRQVWVNDGPEPVTLRLTVDSSWIGADGSGSRFVERHGFTVMAAVRASEPLLWTGLVVPPGRRIEFVVAAALGLAETDAPADLEQRLDAIAGGDGRPSAGGADGADSTGSAAVAVGGVVERQVREYQEWFDHAPTFTSSDPVLDRVWAYRWFLLRHNLAVPRFGGLNGPLFYEGRAHKMTKQPWEPIGWEFSKLIPLSSPMHLLDIRWHPDSSLGTGLWRTLRAAQDPDGLYRSRTVGAQFHAYANFLGWASYQFALVHRDLPDAAPMLESLASQLRGERRLLATGGDELPIESEHILTGKEYQPSYWAFHPYPDDPRDRSGYTPLKRVDRAVYHYRNARGVAGLARLLGQGGSDEFDALADAVAGEVLAKQWDDDTGFFYDLHHRTDQKAMVRNVVGFYPYWAGLVDESHLPGLEAALALFDTGAPLPSVAPDCPVYSPTGSWRGVYVKGRNGCSWNGPTWPYTNSVVIDGVAETSRRFGHRYDAEFGRLLRSYALLHFRHRDGRTPYLVEHYDSSTGEPISDEVDYLHSYVIDLIVRHVAGLEIDEAGGLIVDPLDIGLTEFALSGVRVGGRRVDVTFSQPDGLRVTVDGAQVAAAPGLGPLRVTLDQPVT
ncbi:MGH1-like glycoside hydrolase domain-containing protein [Jiangella gansuensis]|uniref:MGH1-like glycoside hydrolase domain-containing protein n=1 Tax=Jiangella gansuensis TaxID=281473 RepID=UPI0004BACE31|nr:hypothetical protein [Jiangella gansuensis]